ncbi:MAG: aldehyde dehydrogenase family protein, partial [Pseudomonadota bacterium]
MSVAEIFESLETGSASPYGPAPEADGDARAWLAQHEGRLGGFIAGAWREADETFDVTAPATGETLAAVSSCGTDDVDAAVKAARNAQKAWAALPGHVRARHLYALARMVQRNARLFAVVEAMDNGKPIRETRDIDIPLAARHFYHHAGWAQLQETELAGYRPYGVVGQIIPWNFPLLMLAWKIAPALALGNTVVLKPAEQTPLTALLFAELADRAGLPKGVLNVVPGEGETGALIAKHAGIDKVAFTGSTAVGRLIREAAAGSGKGLTLELGGKSPFIVFDDADMDAAIEGVVDAIWFNQGEVCCAGSRL